jgi:hypothetical protein
LMWIILPKSTRSVPSPAFVSARCWYPVLVGNVAIRLPEIIEISSYKSHSGAGHFGYG